MLAANFATNPGSIAMYMFVGAMTLFCAFCVWYFWVPDDEGRTHRGTSVFCLGAALFFLCLGIYQGFTEGNRQEEAAATARTYQDEQDAAIDAALELFEVTSLELNPGDGVVEVRLMSETCDVWVTTNYYDASTATVEFWFVDDNVQRRITSREQLMNLVC